MKSPVVLSLGSGLLLMASGFMRSGVIVPRRPFRRQLSSTALMQTDSGQTNAAGPSYNDRLRQAREAKQKLRVLQEADTSSSTGLQPNDPRGPPSGGFRTTPRDGEPDPPFSIEMQEEIRTAITLLTARLQRKKAMSRREFERFEAAVAVIVEDALPRQELPIQPADPIQEPPPVSTRRQDSQVTSTLDDDESDSPQWDGKDGGYGLPTNTINSYVIDGMGAMNPEEYQEALRQKVIARAQEARRTGSYGNIVSNDYLSFLNKNPKSGDGSCEDQARKKRDEDFRTY